MTSQHKDNHLFHSWSTQRNVSKVEVAGGSGAWFWDSEGKRYLDFKCQSVYLNLGHQHPRMIEAIKRQTDSITTLAQGYSSESRSEAARLIAERAPKNLNKVFFTNSGTDAIENAARMARIHTGRQQIFSMQRSYHGATSGSLSLTGDPRRWIAQPALPGVVRFLGPYLYRSSFSAETQEEESSRALAHLEELIMYEGAHNVAAILMETIVGTNGVLMLPNGYLQGVRHICDKYGILLICDEVMTGFGRCGEWFAVNLWDVAPDLITFAKGVNSGYVPVGGVIVSDSIVETFNDRPYPGGGTYYGHPLACATVVESIKIFEEEGILENARSIGSDIIQDKLAILQEKHASVGEVRGLACFWAIELVKDRVTREPLVKFNATGPDAIAMKEIEAACTNRGLSVFTHSNRIHVYPPLVSTTEDVKLALNILDEALSIADQYVTK